MSQPEYDDLTYYFLRINKVLFQARVYFIKNTKPNVEGDLEEYINNITQLGDSDSHSGQLTSNTFVGPADIESNSKIEYKMKEKFLVSDITEIKETIKLISQGNFDKLNPDKIVISQNILLKFYQAFLRSI